MNRIYQGRVTNVEVVDGRDNAGNVRWKGLDGWQDALWQHHQLFQDAVNYYTLALAALAEGLPKENKTALGWRDRVRDSWKKANRKALRFDGPHIRIAPLLGLDPSKTDFADCTKRVLRNNGSTFEGRAIALVQLLQEANETDLNQLCVSRLPWFCTAKGQFDATPKTVVVRQENTMLSTIRAIHEAKVSQLETVADDVEPGYFVTQFPQEHWDGAEARAEAERLFSVCTKKFMALNDLKDPFRQRLDNLGVELKVARLGRKPKGAYPYVVVFKLMPTIETWECLKQVTTSQYKRAQRGIAFPTVADAIADARCSDEPLFDYFTNMALVREKKNKDRAVWFDFDLAAFIEAIKSPHRYFQDTTKREKDAESIKAKIAAMKGRGCAASGEEDALPGFEGDSRIMLLEELVTDTLGYLAEVDTTTKTGMKTEYSIQERTVRGFGEIRKRWLAAVAKGLATEDELLKVLVDEQGKHRDDFGSATLYQQLAKPKFHSIWRDPGTQPWHAEDPLRAWLDYREFGRELEDKERPIRFTPAHSVHSPRFFILPKQGHFGTKHETGSLAMTAGVVLQTVQGLEPATLRITYAAPRLRRDQLRGEKESDLKGRPWLQPMMQALGLPEPDTADFGNCRVILQPSAKDNIQLTFPVEVSNDKLLAAIGKRTLWSRQFNMHPDGDEFYNASLRWPHEKKPSKPSVPWHDTLDRFSVVAIDLGQRCAGAIARLDVRANQGFDGRPSRFVGETMGKRWRAALVSAKMLRLPGEEQIVWREPSSPEVKHGASGLDFRGELWGERGRKARPSENEDTAVLLSQFQCLEQELMPEDWRSKLSFPEQNDKLLVAARRYQSRIARMHRWCWFLTDDKKRKTALDDIIETDNERFINTDVKAMAAKNDPRIGDVLRGQLQGMQIVLPDLLLRLANRVLPLRDRSWQWSEHEDKDDCHLLTQTGPVLPDVWIRGQRGLSMRRIEQIEELRRRFQSLNQTQLRQIGGKPPVRRDDSIPDCCPDLLDKLDDIKTQRVNQTAHMILAEALGLRLAPPTVDKRRLRIDRDVHGQYVKVRDPVDFIVIEDLSRYRSSQGRAPRENSRLMKWCHRSVREKLRELCEPFGIPVVETPAAYSSRFCSRSGVAGFRAVEVGPGFEREFPWVMLKDKLEDGKPTTEAKWVRQLISQVNSLNDGPNGKPPRTLLAPQTGGPMFVPIVDKANTADLQPVVVQADINAAINLGLRAIADPNLWSIHPRCRTQRQGKEVRTREKRKFGERGQPFVIHREEGVKGDDSRNPNFFVDNSGKLPPWECGTIGDLSLLSGRCLWSEVKKLQWQRCGEVNSQRMMKWGDELPM